MEGENCNRVPQKTTRLTIQMKSENAGEHVAESHSSCMTLGRRISLSEPVCSTLQYEWHLCQRRLWILTERKWEMTHDQTRDSIVISLSSHFLLFFLKHFLLFLPTHGSWNIFIVIENIKLLLCGLQDHSFFMWPWKSYLVSLGCFFIFQMGEMIPPVLEGCFGDETSKCKCLEEFQANLSCYC